MNGEFKTRNRRSLDLNHSVCDQFYYRRQSESQFFLRLNSPFSSQSRNAMQLPIQPP